MLIVKSPTFLNDISYKNRRIPTYGHILPHEGYEKVTMRQIFTKWPSTSWSRHLNKSAELRNFIFVFLFYFSLRFKQRTSPNLSQNCKWQDATEMDKRKFTLIWERRRSRKLNAPAVHLGAALKIPQSKCDAAFECQPLSAYAHDIHTRTHAAFFQPQLSFERSSRGTQLFW